MDIQEISRIILKHYFDPKQISKDIQAYNEVIRKCEAELEAEGKGGVVQNKSRTIIHDDKYIYLRLHSSGVTEYIDYTPELYSYLSRPSCCSFAATRGKRVMIELMEYARAGDRCPVALNRFVYFYYNYSGSIEQFAAECRHIKKKHGQ